MTSLPFLMLALAQIIFEYLHEICIDHVAETCDDAWGFVEDWGKVDPARFDVESSERGRSLWPNLVTRVSLVGVFYICCMFGRLRVDLLQVNWLRCVVCFQT
jgi:hypothetical protein